MYIIVGILLVGAYRLGVSQGIHVGRYRKESVAREREEWINREMSGM